MFSNIIPTHFFQWTIKCIVVVILCWNQRMCCRREFDRQLEDVIAKKSRNSVEDENTKPSYKHMDFQGSEISKERESVSKLEPI